MNEYLIIYYEDGIEYKEFVKANTGEEAWLSVYYENHQQPVLKSVTRL